MTKIAKKIQRAFFSLSLKFKNYIIKVWNVCKNKKNLIL